jgi:hypothetical protein
MACQTGFEAESAIRQISPESQWAQNRVCNPTGEPTWEDPIDQIMQDRCVRCHDYCGSYSAIQTVVNNGELASWMERGHKISGTMQEDVLRWLEIGAPETDCDVPGPECGDNVCDEGETCASCSNDCGVCCGDGRCDSEEGEDCGTCVEDCGPSGGSICCDNTIVAGECCLDEDCSSGETCVDNSCGSSGSDSGTSDSGTPDDSTPTPEVSHAQNGATATDSHSDTESPGNAVCGPGDRCDEDRRLVGYGCSALHDLASVAVVCFVLLVAMARRRGK